VSDGTRLRDEFLPDPSVTFLNHGSFGATPRAMFERYQEWQLEFERQPVLFLARRLDALLAEARAVLGAYVGADPDDLVFVPNATAGVNVAAWPLGPSRATRCSPPISSTALSTSPGSTSAETSARGMCGHRFGFR
jgi:selenocysteine lyase/cysteine desulfurase